MWSLPQPHPGPFRILLDEDHAGRFERGAGGGERRVNGLTPTRLKV
jgi:hypothetical protein